MQPVGVTAPVKGDLFLGVRPEDVEFADPKNAMLTGSVEIIEPAGSTTIAVIRLGKTNPSRLASNGLLRASTRTVVHRLVSRLD
jgi:hypothetical protein